MPVFTREVKERESFLYQRGVVTTTTPWSRPNYQKLKVFLTTVQNETDILDRYDVYIMGGVLFDFDSTWDVDMGLVGGIQSNERLEEDLNYMLDLSLNTYNMLLDISWYETRPENLVYSNMIESNFIQQDMICKKIGYIKKQINEDIEELDRRIGTDIIKLSDYLVQKNRKAIKHTDKMISKVRNNKYTTTVTTFSVKEFLRTDEDHFNTNTNR